MVIAALVLALAGCSGGPSRGDEVAEYTAILEVAGQDPEAEMGRCLALGDRDLRGDCAATVAMAAVRAGGDADAWCARVPAGRWQDECRFQAAEATLLSRDAGRAAALCQQAGAFQADCLMHLWQPRLGSITSGMGADGFADRYAQAQALYARTAGMPGMVADFESRFWFNYFQAGFRSSGRVDPSACAPLEPEGRARCERAAALLLTEPLEASLRQSGRLPWFCGRESPTSADVADLLGASPSPALDQALREQRPQICGGGRPALTGGVQTR